MPGTPEIQPEPAKPKEDFYLIAHNRAVSAASQTADPILQVELFHSTYWHVMAGYGIRPYLPGRL